MINFIGLYEYFFKSAFDISSDTKYIKELSDKGIRSAMIVKKSWIFGLVASFNLFIALIIMIFNAYLTYHSVENSFLMYFIIGFLILNIVLATYSGFSYLIHVKNDSKNTNRIEKTRDLQERLNGVDKKFVRFFNQATLNYFLFYILIGLHFVLFFLQFDLNTWQSTSSGIANIALLFIQSYLIKRYRRKMIDLEMDFLIAHEGEILLVTQEGLRSKDQIISAIKIKTISGEYPTTFHGFTMINYGNVNILTEGDQNSLGSTRVRFVSDPKKTAKLMKELVKEESESEEELLEDIITSIDLKSSIEKKDIYRDVKGILGNNEKFLKKRFDKGDEKVKRNIKELYNYFY